MCVRDYWGERGETAVRGKGYIRGGGGGAWRMRALLRWHTGLDRRGDYCQGGRVYKRERERGSLEDESATKMAYWP